MTFVIKMSAYLKLAFCIILPINIKSAYIYNNNSYTIYEVTAFNLREREYLYELAVKESNVYFPNGVSNDAAIPSDMIVDSPHSYRMEKKLLQHEIEYSYLDFSRPVHNVIQRTGEEEGVFNLKSAFLDYNTIVAWIDSKMKQYPYLEKRLITTTYERRNVFLLKVSMNSLKKPAVFILSGEEGRDWLGIAIVINFVNSLLEDTDLQQILKYFDFYIIPVANPDGYTYSIETSRFSAKNRRVFFPRKMCANHVAIGVDTSRNWYKEKSVPHGSESECNNIYIGHKSFSEDETKSLKNILNKLALKMMAFINVRGIERIITIPFADDSERCANHDQLIDILSSVTDKLYDKFNTTYYFGTTHKFFYNFSGNCADWVKRSLNTPIVYTMFAQLPDTIIPEPSDIEPLLDDFTTIVNETLTIARFVYGPLFDCQTRHNVDKFLLIFVIIKLFTL